MKKAIVILILSVSGLSAWAFSRSAGDETDVYRFVTVERGDLESVVSSTGTLDAVTTVEVGTQVSGIIAEIYADYNDHVEEGQLIARIDPTLLTIAVREAEANLERVEAQLRQADRDYERIRKLFDDQIVAEVDLNQAQYDLEAVRASATSAQVGLEKAQQNLAYATIYAPISGTVVERDVDVGQTVAANFSSPQLFRIAGDLSRMRILVSVDESDIGMIEEGQTARFTVQAYPEEAFTGLVRQVRLQSTAQENIVNYTVVVDVDNTDGRLLPGMTATVDFIVEAATDVVKVANSALRFRPTEEMLAALGERRQPERTRSADASAGQRNQEGRERTPNKRTREQVPDDATLLWYLDDGGELAAAAVRTGLSGGQSTEIQAGAGQTLAIEPGMQIIVSMTAGSSQSASSNPFQSQQQSRSPGPRGPGF